MRIHSDMLSPEDLRVALPPGIRWDIDQHGSRKRARGYEVYLYGSSPYRAQHDRDAHAATYDEWGIWIARCLDLDPNAIMGVYDGAHEFYERTRQWAPYRRQRRCARADSPWLEEKFHHSLESRLPRTRNGHPNFGRACYLSRWPHDQRWYRKSPTDWVIDYWVEQLLYGCPDRFSSCGRLNSLSYTGDRFEHYGWTLAEAKRRHDRRGHRLTHVVVKGMKECQRWGSGGFGPTTVARQAQLVRALREAGIKMMFTCGDPEDGYRNYTEEREQEREKVALRREIVSTLYREVRTRRIPLDSGKARVLAQALERRGYRVRDLLDMSEYRGRMVIMPLRDKRARVVRDAVHDLTYRWYYSEPKALKEMMKNG